MCKSLVNLTLYGINLWPRDPLARIRPISPPHLLIYLSIYIYIKRIIFLYINLSSNLSIYLSIYHWSIYLSNYLSIYLSINPSIYLSIFFPYLVRNISIRQPHLFITPHLSIAYFLIYLLYYNLSFIGNLILFYILYCTF